MSSLPTSRNSFTVGSASARGEGKQAREEERERDGIPKCNLDGPSSCQRPGRTRDSDVVALLFAEGHHVRVDVLLIRSTRPSPSPPSLSPRLCRRQSLSRSFHVRIPRCATRAGSENRALAWSIPSASSRSSSFISPLVSRDGRVEGHPFSHTRVRERTHSYASGCGHIISTIDGITLAATLSMSFPSLSRCALRHRPASHYLSRNGVLYSRRGASHCGRTNKLHHAT